MSRVYSKLSIRHVLMSIELLQRLIKNRHYSIGSISLLERAIEVLAKHDPAYPGVYYLKGLLAQRKGKGDHALLFFVKAKEGWNQASSEFLHQHKLLWNLAK